MKIRSLIKIFPTVLQCLLLLAVDVYAAEPEAAPDLSRQLPSSVTPEQVRRFLAGGGKDNFIILNFDNAGLKDVINTISSVTGKNFILGPGVEARITIHSSGRIPVSEVMNVFESVLEVNGLSIVKSGRFYKIISGAAIKQKPLQVRKGSDAADVPDADMPVTQIIPVKYVPATEVGNILKPMLSQFGSLTPDPRNNLIIVNDLSSSIVRILKVLEEIDVNAFQNTRMIFFKPEYSDVLSLSNELTEVLNALNLTREGIALVPVERINSLVVFSSSPTLLRTVEGWLKRLDEEVLSGQNVFIYPVQNVKAESIAKILTALYETPGGTKPRVVGGRTRPGAKKKGRQKIRAPRLPGTRQPAGGSRVEIIAFEPTNSLVILAPPGIYREMVETIKKIDVYPREVLIEAVIAEVSLSEKDQYGIQWSVLQDISDYSALGQNRSSDAPGFNLPLSLEPVSTTASGLSYLLYKPDRLVTLIHALASRGKVNILSSPRLLVRDQEEANIEVGEDVPTATSTTTSATTKDTLTQNIEYRTVGIKLKIKPTINDEKTVVLDIEQEVSGKGTDQQVGQTGNLFPSFTTTKTKTSIVVPDKQGIVIGGIMEEKKNKSYQGVPLLSSIPLLGNLFRYTSDATVKKELVIIIRPHVITNRSDADRLTMEFMEKLKEVKSFLEEKNEKGFTPPDRTTNPADANES